ncbi:hypothetical protein N9164_07020 [Draconibacterium sp.]|nr:hypothetical protein [Draconibacterium sp.]
MNPISMVGAFLVTLALISYGVGSFSLQRFKIIRKRALWFLSVGIVLDISATLCMILGSTNSPFTVHGFLGYSALLVMSIDIILVWRVYSKNGIEAKIEKPLLIYAKLAYGWWVIAYITGSLLVMLK